MKPGRLERAIAWHVVGILGNLGRVTAHGIGTGVAVCRRGDFFILTANHVIEDTRDLDNLWFLFRDDEAAVDAVAEGKEPEGIRRAPADVERIYRDPEKDLALLRVPGRLAERHNIRFYELPPQLATPAEATQVVLLGYLSKLKQRLPSGAVAAFPEVEWTEITERRPRADFDPALHFFVGYDSAEQRHPQGFSGAGVWLPPASERAAPALAGIVTHYYRASRLLSVVRIEQVLGFLERAVRRR